MSDSQNNATSNLNGALFLYTKPEILNPEAHAGMGLQHPPRPFDFAAKIKALPTIIGEFPNLQRHYPIVFTDIENPVPIAVVGFEDDNLFVTPEGDWAEGCYIPSYLRRHPFALADRPNDTTIVVIDAGSDRVSNNPKFPFFDADNQVTRETRAMMDFCRNYALESERTTTLCKQLVEHNLLINQTAQQSSPDGETQQNIANFVTIDAEKLVKLPDTLMAEWVKDGTLPIIYAQLFSMQNWTALIDRRYARDAAAAKASA